MKVAKLAEQMGLTVTATMEILRKQDFKPKNGQSEIPDEFALELLEVHTKVSTAVNLPPSLPSAKEVKSGEAELPQPGEIGRLTLSDAKTIAEAHGASIETIYTMVDSVKNQYHKILFQSGFQEAERDETYKQMGRAAYQLSVHQERLNKLQQANQKLAEQSTEDIFGLVGIDIKALEQSVQHQIDNFDRNQQLSVESALHLIKTGKPLQNEQGEDIQPDFFTIMQNRINSAISA
ncbi:MAG: hypothetical protein F6J86_45500 [Symploca sp. SIO1B1]|nr:hypothetical protein [Symploca sp. SIO1B1]